MIEKSKLRISVTKALREAFLRVVKVFTFSIEILHVAESTLHVRRKRQQKANNGATQTGETGLLIEHRVSLFRRTLINVMVPR